MAEVRLLSPCRFQIGDEVKVNPDPLRPWTMDWQIPEETWFVAGIRISASGGYDIWLHEPDDWNTGKVQGGTDGFDDEDLSLFRRHSLDN